MNCKVALFIFGTRPEAIKLAPLIKAMKDSPMFAVKVCVTSQHRQMLDQVLAFFEINTDYDLDVMLPNQSLFQLTGRILSRLENVFEESKPDLVFVQGDTTTVLAGALAAYYKKIPIEHLEAGLRSGNLNSPFPEEGNRLLASRLATWHFAPTKRAMENLQREGITSNVFVVGNTVIDALRLGLEKIDKQGFHSTATIFAKINFGKKVILVTGHRRESFGKPFEEICHALLQIAIQYKGVEIVYPVHLNPNVKEPVNRILGGIKNIHLADPLDYPDMLWLMRKSYLILTDSGGIQEEAPSLGKPVLVMRDVTERPEGIEAGTSELVGTCSRDIVSRVSVLLEDRDAYAAMAKAINPYGDGWSSKRIVSILEEPYKVERKVEE